jgi:hypothetical protein
MRTMENDFQGGWQIPRPLSVLFSLTSLFPSYLSPLVFFPLYRLYWFTLALPALA